MAESDCMDYESGQLDSQRMVVDETADAMDVTSPPCEHATTVHFTVLHNRAKYPMSFAATATVSEVKRRLEPLTNVPVDMQKLIYRGLLSDATQLQSLDLNTKDPKIMLIGTSRSAAVEPTASAAKGGDQAATASQRSGRECWSDMPEHKKVLDRHGKPKNATVGLLKTEAVFLPDDSLIGLYNKNGEALRLRVRPDTSELWLTTNALTYRLPLSTIHEVTNQPIKDHPEYHIMAFQFGPTLKSRYFVYWVPAQYVESVKTLVLQYKILHPL